MATPNAQGLELTGQNQHPTTLFQSFLRSQALTQNLPNQAGPYPAFPSVQSSSQAPTTSSQNTHSSLPPSASLSAPQATYTSPSFDPMRQSQVPFQNQAQFLPSSQLVPRPIPPPPPSNQPPSLCTSSTAPYPSQWPILQTPSLGSHQALSAPPLSSSSQHQTLNIEARPLSIVEPECGQTLPTLPPPAPSVCRPYTSMQAPGATDGYGRVVGSQGHSRVTTASGFPGLTVIQRTNHTRLDHASQSLPQNSKKEKRRGKAIRPPGLGRRERVPSIDDCINVASGGVEVMSIDVLVYLPLPPTGEINFYHLPRQLIFYEINKEAYRMVLNALGLFHQYPNLPTSTTIFDLFSDITVKLRQQYNLPSVSSSLPLAPQELLPLQLLGFSNHGRANGSYSTSKLRPMPYERYTTIQNILTNNFGTYVIPKLVITRDNHFTLHASE
ncbi:hypothetical protein F5876DRAFT_81835 [Lentinula aff. lateritia]|uniref:Uncharacterized protein n=1 Tax=Lentinula aff. lateritia TaxID=2804960 RepID=A0ACC1TL81_9AGAR|nr:hypothetical protein F5876DRAFT_81835 [Lentinula aff. lateritia]